MARWGGGGGGEGALAIRKGSVDDQVLVHIRHQVRGLVGGAQSCQQYLTHTHLTAALVSKGCGHIKGNIHKVGTYSELRGVVSFRGPLSLRVLGQVEKLRTPNTKLKPGTW